MFFTYTIALAGTMGAALLGANIAYGQHPVASTGQAYPIKPIRIVTGGVGSGTDMPSRTVAQGLSAALGQQVIVDNRGGYIAPEVAARAPPDGYTLLIGAGTLSIGPMLQQLNYDAVKDFSAITLMTRAPAILVIYPGVAANSVQDLIAIAKARPGELNYASSGSGANNHLSAELFKYMAGVNIVRIPYKSGAAQMADLISGHVQLMFSNSGISLPHVRSGRLKALAVTTAQPSPLVPGVPTISSSGLPGYESSTRTGLMAPARTPAAIIALLNRETVRFLSQPEVKQKFFEAGLDIVASTPREYANGIKEEIVRLGKLIKDVGIRAE